MTGLQLSGKYDSTLYTLSPPLFPLIDQLSLLPLCRLGMRLVFIYFYCVPLVKHALIAPHGVDEQSCRAQVLSEAISVRPNFTAYTVAFLLRQNTRAGLHVLTQNVVKA